MRSNTKIATAVGSLASALFLFAGNASAQSDARAVLDQFREGQGKFQCQRMQMGQSVFFVPQGPEAVNLNVVGWGNGTGGGATTYNQLLTGLCEEGIVVAAAVTANSGQGTEIKAAVDTAIQMSSQQGNALSGKIAADPKILTAGHSQGGCGANNAARLLNADFIINYEADTRFTCQIQEPNPATRSALALYGDADTLAPMNPNNGPALRRNTPGPLVEAEFSNVEHIANGPVGAVTATSAPFRAAGIAFATANLRSDDRAMLAKTLFEGPTPLLGQLTGQGGVVTFFQRNQAAGGTAPAAGARAN
jgi:hypothetical protein